MDESGLDDSSRLYCALIILNEALVKNLYALATTLEASEQTHQPIDFAAFDAMARRIVSVATDLPRLRATLDVHRQFLAAAHRYRELIAAVRSGDAYALERAVAEFAEAESVLSAAGDQIERRLRLSH